MLINQHIFLSNKIAMNETLPIILYTLCAGACIPLGGFIASIENLRPRWLENEVRHFIIALGGGVLLAAVALVLIPEGTKYIADSYYSVLLFISGGVVFFAVERFLGLRRREKPQLIAMLLDYIPESLALGGAFALGLPSAPLLAILIGLQNLPEGFNAYRELRALPKQKSRHILIFMLLLVPIGPVFGVMGWLLLSTHEALLGAIMLFAAGGIMYLIFQDIAPQSHMRRHWVPPLGAVLGFSLGLFGNSLIPPI